MINEAINEVYEAIDFSVPTPSALIHRLNVNWLLSFKPGEFLYMPISDMIALSDPTDAAIYSKIGHWTGHSDRLAREYLVLLEVDCEDQLSGKTVADEVVVGNLIGAALAKANGEDDISAFVKYIDFVLEAMTNDEPSVANVGEAISGIEYISDTLVG